jgi:hypothetical protein
VSIHPDDEFNLRAALESELDDVVPHDGLAGVIIARHRRDRRRRVAGAVGLAIVFAGIGVPLGLAIVPGGTTQELRLAPYTLQLPGQYHLAAATSAPCGPAATGRDPASRDPASRDPVGRDPASRDMIAATSASGACVLMLLAAPSLPRDAREATLGRYHAWLIPRGYWQTPGAFLIIEGVTKSRDLVINSTGLSQSALESVVSAGLS